MWRGWLTSGLGVGVPPPRSEPQMNLLDKGSRGLGDFGTSLLILHARHRCYPDILPTLLDVNRSCRIIIGL